MNQAEKSTVHDLEYAHSEAPLAWVSRHRKRLLLAALLLAIAIPLYQFRQPIRRWAEWQYWFRQCLNHQMPADAKLEVSSPAEVAYISKDPEYIDVAIINTLRNPRMAYVPRAYRELMQRDVRMGSPHIRTQTPAVAFLGRMVRPDGQERLVVLHGSRTNALNLLANVDLLVVPAPGLLDTPPLKVGHYGKALSRASIPAELYPVQLDPTDESHLILKFHVAGVPDGSEGAIGILDGYLQNDDTIHWKLRTVTGDGAEEVNLRDPVMHSMLAPPAPGE